METIVVGTDGSPNAEAAVRRATRIAKGIGARGLPGAPDFTRCG
jgi:nucleotide-binding universal stress UspA family protein